MDVWILIFGLVWLVKVKNVRGFGSIAAFFLTRSLIFLVIFELYRMFNYFPSHKIWYGEAQASSPSLFPTITLETSSTRAIQAL